MAVGSEKLDVTSLGKKNERAISPSLALSTCASSSSRLRPRSPTNTRPCTPSPPAPPRARRRQRADSSLRPCTSASPGQQREGGAGGAAPAPSPPSSSPSPPSPPPGVERFIATDERGISEARTHLVVEERRRAHPPGYPRFDGAFLRDPLLRGSDGSGDGSGGAPSPSWAAAVSRALPVRKSGRAQRLSLLGEEEAEGVEQRSCRRPRRRQTSSLLLLLPLLPPLVSHLSRRRCERNHLAGLPLLLLLLLLLLRLLPKLLPRARRKRLRRRKRRRQKRRWRLLLPLLLPLPPSARLELDVFGLCVSE